MPDEPQNVIDVHTHLFNANFLPIYSVLKKWMSGTWADIAAAYLSNRVDRCEGDKPMDVAANAVDFDALLTEDDEDLIEDLWDPIAAQDGFQPDTRLESLTTAYPFSLSATAQAPNEFHALFRQIADERPRDIFPSRGGYLQWIRLMTWCEQKIWAAVNYYFPAVKLFVAHMMDIEHYYDPHVPPAYSWPDEQLRRMTRLMDASEGKLITFVAFDPRRDDWSEILDKGIKAGCAGVKFYPPNGYPPFDMAKNDFPDQNTRDFFIRCEAEGIPMFTHCTQVGFEAMHGYGARFGSPLLWAEALKRVPNLRLCFGHAGGEPGWFHAVPQGDLDFTVEVVKLCRDFENVYAEVAYLDEVLDPSNRQAFLDRLAPVLPSVQLKLMYGSDWHMINTLKRHAGYLDSWVATLSGGTWVGFRDDFFWRNAIRWLDLSGHAQRRAAAGNPISFEEKAHWNSLGAAIP